MEENKMAKGLILGFIAGGVIGSILGLLYAPKSGKELRADIGKKKDDILDDATEYMQIAKEKATEMINEGKKKKNVATNKKLWQQSLAWARARYDVCPSAYCNGAAVKRYNSKGGKWTKK